VRFKPIQDKDFEDNIIQPLNNTLKALSSSQIVTNKSQKLAINQRRGVSPTEFLSNNEDFGKLKESNDTIFSFGTSKKGKYLIIISYLLSIII